MKLPSKELLSAVLSEDIASVDVIGNTVNYTVLNYKTEEDGELTYIDLGTNISIYELMHLMKVWAIQEPRFIEIFSTTTVGGKGVCWTATEDCGLEEVAMYEESYIYGDTEFEAVTQTCEWLLKQGEYEL
jgi:hypothetical protein